MACEARHEHFRIVRIHEGCDQFNLTNNLINYLVIGAQKNYKTVDCFAGNAGHMWFEYWHTKDDFEKVIISVIDTTDTEIQVISIVSN